MRKPLVIIIISVFVIGLTLTLLSSCKNDLITLDEADITMFLFKSGDNDALDSDYVGTIDGKEISVTLPNGTDVTALKATVVCSAGATCSRTRKKPLIIPNRSPLL
jgi:hypothetical protein